MQWGPSAQNVPPGIHPSTRRFYFYKNLQIVLYMHTKIANFALVKFYYMWNPGLQLGTLMTLPRPRGPSTP
jgi:hypothetical protein